MFYQHANHLWFKKLSLTLVWKPNDPLRSPSPWCGEYKPGSTHKALELKAPPFTWSVKSDSCYNVVYNDSWLLCSARFMKQILWSSTDNALAQVRLCQIFTRALKKWSQSRALICNIRLGCLRSFSSKYPTDHLLYHFENAYLGRSRNALLMRFLNVSLNANELLLPAPFSRTELFLYSSFLKYSAKKHPFGFDSYVYGTEIMRFNPYQFKLLI